MKKAKERRNKSEERKERTQYRERDEESRGNRSRGLLGETQAEKWENCSCLCILFRPQIMCQY